MKLKKGNSFLMVFISLCVIAIFGFCLKSIELINSVINGLLILAGMAFGFNVGDNLQRSVFYKQDLDKENKK